MRLESCWRTAVSKLFLHLQALGITNPRTSKQALRGMNDITMNMLRLFIWTLSAAFTFGASDSKIDLALLGPIYQPATSNSLQAWVDAKQQATDALNQVIATGNNTYGPLDNQGTSFSASVFSLISDEPLFEFHFEAPTSEWFLYQRQTDREHHLPNWELREIVDDIHLAC